MSERCPKCGSDDPKVRKPVMPQGGSMYDWQDCPDPFHTQPTPPASDVEAVLNELSRAIMAGMFGIPAEEVPKLQAHIATLRSKLDALRAQAEADRAVVEAANDLNHAVGEYLHWRNSCTSRAYEELVGVMREAAHAYDATRLATYEAKEGER